jgi:hypothetical protein
MCKRLATANTNPLLGWLNSFPQNPTSPHRPLLLPFPTRVSPHSLPRPTAARADLNLHGGDPVKRQAWPQRPEPSAQLARPVGPRTQGGPRRLRLRRRRQPGRSAVGIGGSVCNLSTSLVEWPLFMASYALSQALPGTIWKDVGLVSRSEHYISRKLGLMLLSYTSGIASVYGTTTNFIILL